MSHKSIRIITLAASTAIVGLLAAGTQAGAAPVTTPISTSASTSAATPANPSALAAPGLLCLPVLGKVKFGTPGDDYLVGTGERDIIFGLGGNDVIFGLGGNDVIFGGDGDDQIWGGPGDDCIRGGENYDESWTSSSEPSGTDDVVAEAKYEY